ncbi:MAG: hypothetical protein AB8I69_22955, partial [Anaerolineae bacterium]
MATINEAVLTIGGVSERDHGMLPVSLRIEVEFDSESETAFDYKATWILKGDDPIWDDDIKMFVEAPIKVDGSRYQTFTFNTQIYEPKLNEDPGQDEALVTARRAF